MAVSTLHHALYETYSRHLPVMLKLILERRKPVSDLFAFFLPLRIGLLRSRTMNIVDSASLYIYSAQLVPFHGRANYQYHRPSISR